MSTFTFISHIVFIASIFVAGYFVGITSNNSEFSQRILDVIKRKNN